MNGLTSGDISKRRNSAQQLQEGVTDARKTRDAFQKCPLRERSQGCVLCGCTNNSLGERDFCSNGKETGQWGGRGEPFVNDGHCLDCGHGCTGEHMPRRIKSFSLNKCVLYAGCNTIKLLEKTQRKAGNLINYFSESRWSDSSRAINYNSL